MEQSKELNWFINVSFMRLKMFAYASHDVRYCS